MKREPKPTATGALNPGISAAPTNDIKTVQEIADHLGLTPASIYELTRFRQSVGQPRIPCRKVGRELRFSLREVDAWFISLPKHKHLQKRQYIRKRAA
jgi:Helix-turn-helix domain